MSLKLLETIEKVTFEQVLEGDKGVSHVLLSEGNILHRKGRGCAESWNRRSLACLNKCNKDSENTTEWAEGRGAEDGVREVTTL